MSRVFVKNLSASAEDADLREHFKNCGAVTDASVVRSAGGESRRFGYVGFSDIQAAQKAMLTRQNTYL